jgi:hypothetical protein
LLAVVAEAGVTTSLAVIDSLDSVALLATVMSLTVEFTQVVEVGGFRFQ